VRLETKSHSRISFLVVQALSDAELSHHVNIEKISNMPLLFESGGLQDSLEQFRVLFGIQHINVYSFVISWILGIRLLSIRYWQRT